MRALLSTVAVCSLVVLFASEAALAFRWHRVATNLRNPRHLSFGSGSDSDNLYIAEAGLGYGKPRDADAVCPTATQCFGNTSAITRVNVAQGPASQQRIVDGLPSVAAQNTGASAQGLNSVSAIMTQADDDTADCLGAAASFDRSEFDPETISSFHGELQGNNANVARPVLYGVLTCQFKAALKQMQATVDYANMGKLLEFKSSKGTYKGRAIADICAYEEQNNPDGLEINSNPYDLLTRRHRTTNRLYHIVADAGANAVYRVNHQNKISPLFSVTYQSVPTGVTLSGDHLYVSELTGAPFPEKGGKVYRVTSNGEKTPVENAKTTTASAITHDGAGNVYVLEMLHRGLAKGPANQDFRAGLIKIAPSGEISRLLPCPPNSQRTCEDISFAGGIAYRNYKLYVSTGTNSASGEVVEIPVVRMENYFQEYDIVSPLLQPAP